MASSALRRNNINKRMKKLKSKAHWQKGARARFSYIAWLPTSTLHPPSVALEEVGYVGCVQNLNGCSHFPSAFYRFCVMVVCQLTRLPFFSSIFVIFARKNALLFRMNVCVCVYVCVWISLFLSSSLSLSFPHFCLPCRCLSFLHRCWLMINGQSFGNRSFRWGKNTKKINTTRVRKAPSIPAPFIRRWFFLFFFVFCIGFGSCEGKRA